MSLLEGRIRNNSVFQNNPYRIFLRTFPDPLLYPIHTRRVSGLIREGGQVLLGGVETFIKEVSEDLGLRDRSSGPDSTIKGFGDGTSECLGDKYESVYLT